MTTVDNTSYQLFCKNFCIRPRCIGKYLHALVRKGYFYLINLEGTCKCIMSRCKFPCTLFNIKTVPMNTKEGRGRK